MPDPAGRNLIIDMLKSRLLGEPLLHFLVLGAALFGLYAVSGGRRGESAGSQEIVVGARTGRA